MRRLMSLHPTLKIFIWFSAKTGKLLAATTSATARRSLSPFLSELIVFTMPVRHTSLHGTEQTSCGILTHLFINLLTHGILQLKMDIILATHCLCLWSPMETLIRMKHQNTHGITCSDTKITPLVGFTTPTGFPIKKHLPLLHRGGSTGGITTRLLFQYSTPSHI